MRGSMTAQISTAIGAAALVLCLAAGAGIAAPKRPSGGGPHPHPGAGPGAQFHPHINAAPQFHPHISAAPQFHPHISAAPQFHPHISSVPRFHPHISAGPRLRPHVHVGRFNRPTLRGRLHPHVRITRRGPSIVHTHRGRLALRHHAPNVGGANAGRAANLHPRLTGATDPSNFAAHRHLAGIGAFHPFFHRGWHRHGHLGWVGPLFWPYAYGDFFYYALWPYEYGYYDPFWYYGYDDIYEGIFSPYNYTEYVQGPAASERMAALTKSAQQSCTDEASEVTGWPIDQIQSALQPNKQQTALLDALGNAVVKASDVIRAHCPTKLAFTPTDRLVQMQNRLQGLLQAVNIVQPLLAKFYDSLSDEQKARFNAIGAPGGEQTAQGKNAPPNPQAECGQSVMSFPTDRIEQSLHLSDAQHAKLEALQAANTKAVDLIKASCPSEPPATPPDRLAAEGKHLQAMLQAVQTIRPPLDGFYNSLSDEQKAHFNTLGRQLFAAK
jgi:hypothetical protein